MLDKEKCLIKMKKVAIVTIIDNNNYGNRVQNYAVQEVLKKINCQPETIINWPETNKANDSMGEIKQTIYRKLRDIKRKIKYLTNNKARKRYKCFKKFNEENMILSKNTITYKNAEKIQKKYEFFIVGSDQVWNPNFNRLSEIDLLTFSDKRKNIAYSASFGVSSIPNKYQEKCKKAFSNFKNISVREEAGKNIINQLNPEKKVDVLIDPTMMLNDEEWSKIINKPEQLKQDKYILNYFLGELSEERKREIERVAKENHCEMINILDKEFYATGPSEFLYLTKNAFLVCTDSFHSCVFSILFKRPFVVFNREDNEMSMNSRIETLLKKFALEERYYNEIRINNQQLKNDYQQAYKILEEERKQAFEFLKQSMK